MDLITVESNYYKIKLSYNPGRCSYGEGETIEKAIKSAAWGMNIDWWSVERRMMKKNGNEYLTHERR